MLEQLTDSDFSLFRELATHPAYLQLQNAAFTHIGTIAPEDSHPDYMVMYQMYDNGIKSIFDIVKDLAQASLVVDDGLELEPDIETQSQLETQ